MMKIPQEKELLDNLNKISYTLDKSYLSDLATDAYMVLPFDKYNENKIVEYVKNIRALRIERWVYDKDENIGDCFKNVLSVFAGTENSLALFVRRTPHNTEFYFVIKNIGPGCNEDSLNNIDLLRDALQGNFQGSKIETVKEKNNGADTKKCFHFDGVQSIAALCNIPSEKSEDYICQGIDKLLNGIVPEKDDDSYSIVILAEAIPQTAIREILTGYEEIATAITPFAGYQFQSGINDTKTTGEMESMSHSDGISHAISKTHSVNVGVNLGMNSAATVGGGAAVGALGTGLFASIANTLGVSFGVSAGYGYSWGTSDTKSSTDNITKGSNHSVSLGTSENTTYTFKSYMVSNLIEKLEATIKRINESQATGLWKCAAYVLGSDEKTTKNVASFLHSITQGDKSFVEPSVIQAWSYNAKFNEIIKYISHFCHPVFMTGQIQENTVVNAMMVTPTANVTTSELSDVLAFPRHSVQGLPVIECARFGREPHSLLALQNDIAIGCSYHMYQPQEKKRIFINKEELTKHTFITGSTGSGKSNAIYTLINRLCYGKDENKPNFLVIEPAKGEYKDVFGGREDVTVYGTNPFKTPNLLQINPFSFPNDVHVLEHIDRLVEVFNACWPMYAAMPAILKESVEKAYEDCGWNLKLSKYPGRFPTFDELLAILPEVVETSGYSNDTSSDYKGALVTRIRSLTRGIHGQIFASDVQPEKLFKRNVIVDISRVGSTETKALIMGILILKLQEFRMSEDTSHNSGLRHITVLEEAHNLLCRTSSEQSQESSNLRGKSVEMIANAIAEMRTYGEGFVIADQSPELMDISVIRNTNTKIIMHLPYENDRQLVGKAAGLNESQVDELSRLEKGVAAISQSDWLEPVLCKVDLFKDKQSIKDRFKTDTFIWADNENAAIQQFLRVALDVEHSKLTKDVADKVRKWYGNLDLSEKARYIFENIIDGNSIDAKQKMLLIYYVVGKKIKKITVLEDASAEAQRTISGKYGFDRNEEVIRRINELFLSYFPVNPIFDNIIEQVEKSGKEGKAL